VRFGRSDQAAELEALIDGNTRALFCETVGNPAGNICDLEALAAVARRAQVPFIVDNTVPTPILVRRSISAPTSSCTRSPSSWVATARRSGAIVDSGKFPWTQHARRFPAFTEPTSPTTPHLYRALRREGVPRRGRSVFQRTMGAVLAPFNAFLLLQGIETVALRVERHVENGRRVAEFLRQDRASPRSATRAFPTTPTTRSRRSTWAAAPARS